MIRNERGQIGIWASCCGDESNVLGLGREITGDFAKWIFNSWLPPARNVKAKAALFWCLAGRPHRVDLQFDSFAQAVRHGVWTLDAHRIRLAFSVLANELAGISHPTDETRKIKICSYHGMLGMSGTGENKFWSGMQWGKIRLEQCRKLIESELDYYREYCERNPRTFELVIDAAGADLPDRPDLSRSQHAAGLASLNLDASTGVEPIAGIGSWIAANGGNVYVLDYQYRDYVRANFSLSYGGLNPAQCDAAGVRQNILYGSARPEHESEIREHIAAGRNVFLDGVGAMSDWARRVGAEAAA